MPDTENNSKKQPTSLKHQLSSIGKVLKRTYTISPAASIVKLIDSLINAILPIITTYFAAQTTTALTDAYSGVEGASQSAITFVIITAALGLMIIVWRGVSNYIDMKTRYKIRSTIEDEITRQFGSLPFHMYDDKQVIDLHDKALRFSYGFSYVVTTISSILTAILGGIGSIAALAIVSPWLSLAILLAATPGVWLHLKLARNKMELWDGTIQTRRKRYLIYQMIHTPKNIAEARVYNSLKHLLKTHTRLRDDDEGRQTKLTLNMTGRMTGSDLLEAIVQLVSLIWVTLQIIAQSQPVGQFLYVQQLVSRTFSQVSLLAGQLGSIDEDLAHMIEYQAFMEIETNHIEGKKLTSTPESIKLIDVNFSYPKTDQKTLQDINLEINQGERIAIVGENGAGKSTLIKLIMGLYHPTSGQISLGDQDLRSINLESWHRQVSLLMQDFTTYTFANIKDNIRFGNINQKFDEKKFDQAMRDAEFTEVVKKLDRGVNTYVSRQMSDFKDRDNSTELSGGQSQRLALARNFYRDSPIIILDEPTSAIDALAENRIFQRLFSRKDKTIIIVSHRLTTVEKADRIYVIKAGQLAESGTHKELVKSRGEYYTMFESQLREGELANDQEPTRK